MPDYKLKVSFNAKVRVGTKLDKTDLVESIRATLEVWAIKLGVTLSNTKVEVA